MQLLLKTRCIHIVSASSPLPSLLGTAHSFPRSVSPPHVKAPANLRPIGQCSEVTVACMRNGVTHSQGRKFMLARRPACHAQRMGWGIHMERTAVARPATLQQQTRNAQHCCIRGVGSTVYEKPQAKVQPVGHVHLPAEPLAAVTRAAHLCCLLRCGCLVVTPQVREVPHHLGVHDAIGAA